MKRRFSLLAGLVAVACSEAGLAWAHWHHEWHHYDSWHQGSRYGGAQASQGPVFPAQDALPNPRLTPGALNPNVTQANLDETVCRPGGYTRSIRPPEDYTEKLKREQIRQYGYVRQVGDQAYRMGDYEEDHYLSLSLGGSPSDPKNLWPEPHNVQGGWGSYAKDRLEFKLHDLLCSHQITLAQAQSLIATNWVDAYKRLIGPTPDNTPMDESQFHHSSYRHY